MAKITDEMKDIASKAKGWAVATATKKGIPNVVSIAFGKVLSENQILLMDVFMKKTEENIKANPKVAASVWDMASMKGYQFKGDAKIVTSGKVFDEGVQMVKSMMPQLTPKAAVIVDVKEIYITSPGPDAGKLVS
jgi:hypothetical protein